MFPYSRLQHERYIRRILFTAHYERFYQTTNLSGHIYVFILPTIYTILKHKTCCHPVTQKDSQYIVPSNSAFSSKNQNVENFAKLQRLCYKTALSLLEHVASAF